MSFVKPKLLFLSGNTGKLKEVCSILGESFDIVAKNIDLPEYQGEPREIVVEKCKAALSHCTKTEMQDFNGLLIEDTSLCFNAWGGMPGPYIKWFLKNSNNEILWRMLKDFDNKTAFAMCIFGFVQFNNHSSNPDITTFEGKIAGSIVSPRGCNNFGWDPIFQPDGYCKTFAELSPDIKNKISHRHRALMELKTFLSNK